MGQYFMVVNLDKKEFIDPHKLGTGLKLWEQLANHPGTGAALIILCASLPEKRGGGDFDLEENWHGVERKFPEHNGSPGPMPEGYQTIARRTIGRWAGNRIALVGDYAKDEDLLGKFKASKIYDYCLNEVKEVVNDNPDGAFASQGSGKFIHLVITKPSKYKDISLDVCAVIEHELGGKYTGDGWRHFEYTGG